MCTTVTRNVAGMVLGVLVGFICVFLFFVDDDGTEILNRRENRRACANDNVGTSLANAAVSVVPLPCREPRMDDGYALAIACAKNCHRLRRECDFGKQNDNTTILVEQFIDEREHYAGFATACNTV